MTIGSQRDGVFPTLQGEELQLQVCTRGRKQLLCPLHLTDAAQKGLSRGKLLSEAQCEYLVLSPTETEKKNHEQFTQI